MRRFMRLGAVASVAGLAVAGLTGSVASAEAASIGPSKCTAYVSHTNEHVAVGMCAKGNGTWYVQAKCAGPGRVNGPYKGDQGYRTRGVEKASVINCGTSGFPIEMKVVDVRS